MTNFFLSHNNKDKVFVRKLSQELMKKGYNTWIDETKIGISDSLTLNIEKAISNCSYFGVILSPESVNSDWVQKEIEIALKAENSRKKIKIILIRIKKCNIPKTLLDKFYIDFTEGFEIGFDILIDKLRRDLQQDSYNKERVLENINVYYQDWLSFGKKQSHLLDLEIIKLLNESPNPDNFSIETLEYVLISISLLIYQNKTNPNIINIWISNIKFNNLEKIFKQIIENPDSNVCIGFVMGISQISDIDFSMQLLTCLENEKKNNLELIRLILKYLSIKKKPLPKNISDKLFKYDDWVIQTYSIFNDKENLKSLIISDDTDFANEITNILSETGFKTIVINNNLNSLELNQIQDEILKLFDLIVLIKGEHYAQFGLEDFYIKVKNYVLQGGCLFATPWVSWETKHNNLFRDLLPFTHIADSYNENKLISCMSTLNSISKQLLDNPISFYSSYELLSKKDEAVILQKINNDIPFFGYKINELGTCYYLNTCQHSCSGFMDSPIKNNTRFKKYIEAIFKWIFDERNKVYNNGIIITNR